MRKILLFQILLFLLFPVFSCKTGTEERIPVVQQGILTEMRASIAKDLEDYLTGRFDSESRIGNDDFGVSSAKGSRERLSLTRSGQKRDFDLNPEDYMKNLMPTDRGKAVGVSLLTFHGGGVRRFGHSVIELTTPANPPRSYLFSFMNDGLGFHSTENRGQDIHYAGDSKSPYRGYQYQSVYGKGFSKIVLPPIKPDAYKKLLDKLKEKEWRKLEKLAGSPFAYHLIRRNCSQVANDLLVDLYTDPSEALPESLFQKRSILDVWTTRPMALEQRMRKLSQTLFKSDEVKVLELRRQHKILITRKRAAKELKSKMTRMKKGLNEQRAAAEVNRALAGEPPDDTLEAIHKEIKETQKAIDSADQRIKELTDQAGKVDTEAGEYEKRIREKNRNQRVSSGESGERFRHSYQWISRKNPQGKIGSSRRRKGSDALRNVTESIKANRKGIIVAGLVSTLAAALVVTPLVYGSELQKQLGLAGSKRLSCLVKETNNSPTVFCLQTRDQSRLRQTCETIASSGFSAHVQAGGLCPKGFTRICRVSTKGQNSWTVLHYGVDRQGVKPIDICKSLQIKRQ